MWASLMAGCAAQEQPHAGLPPVEVEPARPEPRAREPFLGVPRCRPEPYYAKGGHPFVFTGGLVEAPRELCHPRMTLTFANVESFEWSPATCSYTVFRDEVRRVTAWVAHCRAGLTNGRFEEGTQRLEIGDDVTTSPSGLMLIRDAVYEDGSGCRYHGSVVGPWLVY